VHNSTKYKDINLVLIYAKNIAYIITILMGKNLRQAIKKPSPGRRRLALMG